MYTREVPALFVFACCVFLLSSPGHSDPLREDARVFRGEHLDAVAMPIGGIGTGSIWLTGDGRLCVWQIFNNSDERPLPDTFFALRVAGEEEPVRLLQRGEGWRIPGFSDVSCVGEYPLLRIRYEDGDLPVSVRLEGFNPMVPTNTRDSSIPTAIFRLTACNRSDRVVAASFLMSLMNPIGYIGGAELASRFYRGFGGNHNHHFRRGDGASLLHLGTASTPGSRMGGDVKLFVSGREDRSVLHCTGIEALGFPRQGVPAVDAVWIEGITGGERGRIWQLLDAAAREGKTVLLSGPDLSFFKELVAHQGGEKARYEFEVFEDFEDGTYDGWKLEGTAFGEAPHTGTSPNQQIVSGFSGKRLVNTYRPGDEPKGRLTSKEFTIEKRYIGLLVGGGAHAKETCVNLLVDGKVVYSQTGRNLELLEPAAWDVSELRGNKARIEIVDQHRGGWGHINVDQIIFSDTSPLVILATGAGLEDVVKHVEARILEAGSIEIVGRVKSPFAGVDEDWTVKEAISLRTVDDSAFEVLAMRGGVPLLVRGPFGKGKIIIALGRGLPASWGMTLLGGALGVPYRHGEGIPRGSRLFGNLTLASPSPRTTVCARWTDVEDLWKDFRDDGQLSGPETSGVSPLGETYNCAMSVSLSLEPGEESTADFILTWYFPNVDRFGHEGNKYADWFSGSTEAGRYVLRNFQRLVDDTYLYHDTMYESNLPYLVLDAITSQTVIFRGPTCWWARKHKETGKDYFAGFEGCYGCCPLNCTHVWNYAQSHARLYPEIGRNLRWYDFNHYLRETGETHHRQHAPTNAFIDGHAAVIEGAYREHLMSPDNAFLEEIYPGVKKAMEWLIGKIDPDENGVNEGQQYNTYDVATDGAHTFLGSQYLSALGAAEKMALVMKDAASADRWRKIREKGSVNQDRKLWNGEYWIQIPDRQPARDYNTGCHSDQLLGQWWTHMFTGGEYLYPPEHVKTALRSIFRYNFRTNFRGFQQRPRRYVLDGEGGLLMCSWPKGGRPDPFILYADEIWTGIEYEVAGLMVYEGLVDEGFRIVETARKRYDGRVRPGLNSGPGGNPFNELECGKFYARAMSSWGLLLASQGFIYDGPRGILGFKPRWKPQDHRSFFGGARGWGLFTQRRIGSIQTERIECRWGSLQPKELVFETPEGETEVELAIHGEKVRPRSVERTGREVRIGLPEVFLGAGKSIEVTFRSRAFRF